MSNSVDLYHSTYQHHASDVLSAVRRETHDEDIGQNSWLNAAELRGFIEWLDITADDHVLEVACGSGGPACYVAARTGCRLTGVDSNADGIAEARAQAERAGVQNRATFAQVDANERLPFGDSTFDALLCVDAINHLRDREFVLREWHRVLRPGSGLVFTDPVVVTGPVTNIELAIRSSIGFFLFVPVGYTDELLLRAGFEILRVSDESQAAAEVSSRRRAARARHRDQLVEFEGDARFEGLQDFLQVVHDLSATRRLSRFVYHARKP